MLPPLFYFLDTDVVIVLNFSLTGGFLDCRLKITPLTDRRLQAELSTTYVQIGLFWRAENMTIYNCADHVHLWWLYNVLVDTLELCFPPMSGGFNAGSSCASNAV